jgi:hypothetical protein
MTDQYTTYDAAYLLGALSPADRAEFEEHLRTCDDCRRAVSRVAGLPGLLAGVPSDAVAAAAEGWPEPPPTLLPRLMAEVERSRFRRRAAMAGIGLAAAAVLVVGLVVGVRGLAPASHPAAGPSPQTGQTSSGTTGFHPLTPVLAGIPIEASARFTSKSWGTDVTLHCSYETGSSLHYPTSTAPLTYTMVVTTRSGQVQQIAAWAVTPGKPVSIDGWTSVPRAQIASIQVRDEAKTPVLQLQL